MDWSGDGIILAVRPHGEAAAVVSLLTAEHGRWAGLVRGARGRRSGAIWQPGNLVAVAWRARVEEQLGNLSGELVVEHAARQIDDPLRLAALTAACAMVDATLPERQPHAPVFAGLLALIEGLGAQGWPADYVRWELALLGELGFGLDLSCCAATGSREDLAYVSPRTGRAVSRRAAQPYLDRLLPLPRFLVEEAVAEPAQLVDGMVLTEYFLARHVLPDRALPAARTRLLERLRRAATISGRGMTE